MTLAWGSKARHFKWEVDYMYAAPDCLENVVMGINGQFPGPTIKARAGDTVVVHLTNKLHTEGVVIHWHGIRQVRLIKTVRFIGSLNAYVSFQSYVPDTYAHIKHCKLIFNFFFYN